MSLLGRRVEKLEGTAKGRRFWRLSDADLDARLRAELGAFMAATPDRCPDDIRGEVLAFLAADDAEAPGP
jgi:hypothetical protein